MPRVKRGVNTKRRHNKLRKSTKGYQGSARRSVKKSSEARLHALKHGKVSRRLKKRDYRSLWIVRINNALRLLKAGTYSTFVHQMKLKDVQLDRKTLAYLADQMPDVFKAVVKFVRSK